ncbi:DUF3558 family protein [Amycolatopsis sp. NPDC059027]|uniref:DUF3558 family protein n=1 Tax=unclassified Amycolatopsis TaxID=2618356 RepID=UPI0036716C8C
MRISRLGAAVLAGVVAVLLGGCTATVGGSAAPVPGQGPVKKVVDACTLLSSEQAAGLGFEGPGKPQPASEKQRTPASCIFSPKDDSGLATTSIGWAVDLRLDDYLGGALKKDSVQSGGFTWTQYASSFPGFCTYILPLGPQSFVDVGVSANEETKSCEVAKKVLPFVSSHLPGGETAPSITPSTPPQPSGPLATLDPCTLLKPEQAQQLKVEPAGKSSKSTVTPNAVFCLWKDTDGAGGQKSFEVWLGPTTPYDKWPAFTPPGQPQDVNGRKWVLLPNEGGMSAVCGAVLPITDTSSVYVTSGFLDDDSKACDAVKAGLPMVGGNLPAS